MYHKVKAVVLKTVKYSDSAFIAHLYTDTFGRQSYFVRISKKNKNPNKIYFQTLSILQIECTHKENKLNTIREINFLHPYLSIPSSPEKAAVTFLIAEILEKTIKEEESNPVLFNFIVNQQILLDSIDKNISWFHIYYLINLTKQIGIQPDIINIGHIHDPSGFFNLQQAVIINEILNSEFDKIKDIHLEHSEKMYLLEKIILYYQIKYDISDIKSYKILREIFK